MKFTTILYDLSFDVDSNIKSMNSHADQRHLSVCRAVRAMAAGSDAAPNLSHWHTVRFFKHKYN
jgi:hypothetical protein